MNTKSDGRVRRVNAAVASVGAALALLLSAASAPTAEAANCLAEETGPGSDAYSVSTRTQIFELAENTRQPDLQGHGVLVGHISVVHPNDVALISDSKG